MSAHDDLTNDPAFIRASKAAAVLVALTRTGNGPMSDEAAALLARGVLMAWAQAGGMSGASADRLRVAAEKGIVGRGEDRAH